MNNYITKTNIISSEDSTAEEIRPSGNNDSFDLDSPFSLGESILLEVLADHGLIALDDQDDTEYLQGLLDVLYDAAGEYAEQQANDKAYAEIYGGE